MVSYKYSFIYSCRPRKRCTYKNIINNNTIGLQYVLNKLQNMSAKWIVFLIHSMSEVKIVLHVVNVFADALNLYTATRENALTIS